MKKKEVIITLVLCLFIGCTFALEDWNLKKEKLILDIDIKGNINLTAPKKIDFLEVELLYFPKDDPRQQIKLQDFYPKESFSHMNVDGVFFEFINIYSNIIEYNAYSRVESINKITEVNKKIPFPLINVPKETIIYTYPSEAADSDNEKIIQLAQDLAEGENDLYLLVSKIAFWIKDNIAYDLEVSNIKYDLTASWVLKYKRGVCKEKTNLFIALLKSLGIPARFISGTAYTNSELFEEGWGPHAWAEVYFPTVGWAPYDLTYQQFSYVDATHIKLKESIDSSEDTIRYKWKERGSDIAINPVVTQTSLINSSGTVTDKLQIKIRPFYPEVGFGSYNLIVANMTNTKNSYLTSLFIMANVSGMTIIDNTKAIIFKPRETKQILWIVKMKENFSPGFYYDIPIEISSTLNPNNSSKGYFRIDDFSKLYSLENINHLIEIYYKTTKDIQYQSPNISLICKLIRNKEVYINTSVEIGCSIVNRESINFNNVKICLENDCKTIDLAANQEDQLLFRKKITEFQNRYTINLITPNASKNSFLIIPIMEKPIICVTELDYPNKVNITETFQISFVLMRKSQAIPQNVKLKISLPYEIKRIDFDKLKQNEPLSLKLKGANLKEGKNIIAFDVTYEDDQHNSISYKKEITIELSKLTIKERILVFLSHIKQSIGRILGNE